MQARTAQAVHIPGGRLLLFLLLTLTHAAHAGAQDRQADADSLERRLARLEERGRYLPRVHGILRGKYEYEPGLQASRFEVRNARLSASGALPLRSEYKLEVDLCDESSIKMKDAWARVTPWRTLRFTIGQQRMPFSIDAHRNPSAQYFANRSFIAKQVGDMRDVGLQVGYDFVGGARRKVLSLDAGLFNGSNLDHQRDAWFSAPAYSARLQFYPVRGLALVPSVQHQQIAERRASYTSVDFGAYYESRGWHVEAEFLRKMYAHDAFSACNAVDAMAVYRHAVGGARSFLQSLSGLVRYDYMQAHSSGKDGFEADQPRLRQTDAERHRLTVGLTCSLRNPYFPTDIRLNYEKYWYPHGGAKESERDKVVCELMVNF